MREFLFRGKDKHTGEMIFGTLDNIDEPYQILFRNPNRNNNVETHTVIAETVGQFTGLTDKNGTRIFEGDIVICKKEIYGNFIDSCVEIGFVEMKHGAFGLHRKQGYYRPFKDWLEDYEYEVIGNIHDNPDILNNN